MERASIDGVCGTQVCGHEEVSAYGLQLRLHNDVLARGRGVVLYDDAFMLEPGGVLAPMKCLRAARTMCVGARPTRAWVRWRACA